MRKVLFTILASVSTAALLHAKGHTDKVAETVEADIQQIVNLPARLAIAAWMALSPAQREEILEYITPQQRAVLVDDFESILKVDRLKP
jgi:hypothetical protein